MESTASVEHAHAGIPGRAWIARWFAGLTRTGFAIVVVAALINATRRSIINLQVDPFDAWIFEWLQHLASSLLIGTAMLLAVVFAANRYPVQGARQYAAIAVTILISGSAAWSLVLVAEHAWDTMQAVDVPVPDLALWSFVAGSFRYTVLGALIAGTWLYLRAEEAGAAAAHRCDVEAAQLEAQAAQAQLQVLEAQIEPHFLFNVLATVKRLFETDAEAGGRMLDNLMRYLTMALPQMRESGTTLGREAALAEAYLDIQKIRMGRRLACHLDIPSSLQDAPMPSLMLATLVENAVRHGIAPLPEGGSITISARVQAGCVHVRVADTGRGFVATSGAGTGLANIRARLIALYGDDGRLALAALEPQGVAATLIVPLSRARGGLGETDTASRLPEHST
jgi:hypothetical protein